MEPSSPARAEAIFRSHFDGGLGANVAQSLGLPIGSVQVAQAAKAKIKVKHQIATEITIPIMRRCVGRTLRELCAAGVIVTSDEIQALLASASDAPAVAG